MKAALLFFSAFLLHDALHAQTLDWVRQARGAGSDEGRAIATDPAGNSYVTGNFSDTAYFGNAEIISAPPPLDMPPNTNVFITKLDAEGDFLWATQAGGMDGAQGNGIATDASGNSHVIGAFAGTSEFGSTTHTSAGEWDIFISKLNTQGEFIWTARVGGTASDIGNSIATDAAGNSYVTGYFRNTATFGSTTLTATGPADSFFAKLDANGNFLWAKRVGAMAVQQSAGNGITADAAGNSYVTGYYQGTVTFGNTTLTPVGTTNTYIAKLDTDGNFLWAKRAGGGTDFEKGSGVALDGAGNCYVSGRFSGVAEFGNISHTAETTADAFIAKLDANGNFLWVQRGMGTGYNTAESIATDATGNCSITGWFRGTVNMGNTTLEASGSSDIFVAQLDANGNFLWAQRAGSPSPIEEGGTGIATDATGNCIVTGDFRGTADVGGTTLTAVRYADVLIAKFSTGTTSIRDDQRSGSIMLFPNPASSILHIRTDDVVKSVDIFNSVGTLVRTETSRTFSVEQLPSGVYLLRIRTGDGMYAQRLVKE